MEKLLQEVNDEVFQTAQRWVTRHVEEFQTEAIEELVKEKPQFMEDVDEDRTKLFNTLSEEPFVNNDELKVRNRTYFYDEGSEETIELWKFKKLGKFVILDFQRYHEGFPVWARSQPDSYTHKVFGFSTETILPLVIDLSPPVDTEDNDGQLRIDHEPYNLISWHAFNRELIEVRKAYQRQEMFAKANTLIEQNAKKNITPANIEIAQLEAVEDGVKWTLARRSSLVDNRTQFDLRRENLVGEPEETFVITLDPDNNERFPRINTNNITPKMPETYYKNQFRIGIDVLCRNINTDNIN